MRNLLSQSSALLYPVLGHGLHETEKNYDTTLFVFVMNHFQVSLNRRLDHTP